MSNNVPFLAPATFTVPVSARLAVYSEGYYSVTQLSQPQTNGPVFETILFRGVGAYTSSVFAAAANIRIEGGSNFSLLYSVGTDATIVERLDYLQPTPGTLNATGALTAALMYTGIVTSTTAAAVTATLPTGAVMDASGSFAINDSFDWTAIATGANAFTVTGATNHTVVGAGAVATGTSGRFRTRKTAASTFVTYRI